MERKQKEGTGVRMMRMAAALLAAVLLPAACAAQTVQTDGEAQRAVPVEIYVAQDAMDRETAERLMQLLGQAFEEGAFTAVYEQEAGSLRDLVMADRAPDAAICAPHEAVRWAAEGMLLPLDGLIEDLACVQPEVLDACVLDESLFMAPLTARHRLLAVNARMVHDAGLGALLDAQACPMWYPSQLNLILEELADTPGMEIWPALGEDGMVRDADAPLDFLQALYGGEAIALADGHGTPVGLLSSLVWLQEMTRCGMVGVSGGRQAALDRFLDGETALFIDWHSGDEARYAARLHAGGVELRTMPYPSATGLSARSYDLAGISVFTGGGVRQTALAVQAAAFLCGDERALSLLGGRGIWQDGAFWLRGVSTHPYGATLRMLLARAQTEVIAGEAAPQEAVEALRAAALTLP
ncbi:MAG: hypothetical protein J6K32_09885 [Clostridia bacterium]|nr:hypothetical protein [Clostridia bacterium]